MAAAPTAPPLRGVGAVPLLGGDKSVVPMPEEVEVVQPTFPHSFEV